MFTSLRTKLFLIVGTATLAVALVLATGMAMGARFSRDLNDVEARLVPKVTLGLGQFSGLTRSCEPRSSQADPGERGRPRCGGSGWRLSMETEFGERTRGPNLGLYGSNR